MEYGWKNGCYPVRISSWCRFCRKNISPRYLIVSNQSAARLGVPNKALDIAVFGNLNIRKYHDYIDGVRYPRDGVSIDYASIDCVDHYRALKLFYKEYVGEELTNAFVTYTDMKNKNPIQVNDFRFQVDHFNPKQIQLFDEYRSAINNARLFMILFKHREIKMISDGNEITELDIILKWEYSVQKIL